MRNRKELIFFLFRKSNLLLSVVSSTRDDGENFARTIDRKLLGLRRKEKLAHFKRSNPTSIIIQPPVKKYSTTYFGGIFMIDNALTAKVSRNSTLIGRHKVFYAGAAQKELGLIMAMNFVFKTGKYNGSTITILGRNSAMSEVREMRDRGRKWLFSALLEAMLRREQSGTRNLDATVEYSCYVLHY
ncbi:hypothetical protein HID58_024511 [Brassica napus]|uniref:Dirigent protein n=1 Tax=Brassica napus TaxID=3708 RepID=A0ABQ7XJ22_BRANA|nr:hypothetical protein HID58_024511 [Brassica napus]